VYSYGPNSSSSMHAPYGNFGCVVVFFAIHLQPSDVRLGGNDPGTTGGGNGNGQRAATDADALVLWLSVMEPVYGNANRRKIGSSVVAHYLVASDVSDRRVWRRRRPGIEPNQSLTAMSSMTVITIRSLRNSPTVIYIYIYIYIRIARLRYSDGMHVISTGFDRNLGICLQHSITYQLEVSYSASESEALIVFPGGHPLKYSLSSNLTSVDVPCVKQQTKYI